METETSNSLSNARRYKVVAERAGMFPGPKLFLIGAFVDPNTEDTHRPTLGRLNEDCKSVTISREGEKHVVSIDEAKGSISPGALVIIYNQEIE